MPHVLLLGGSGAIGRYLQKACLNRGYEVTVTTRRNRTVLTPGVTYLKGNALEKGFVTELLDNTRFDVIVDFMVYSSGEFRDRVGAFLKRTEHYIFLSSYRVFADIAGAPITEKTPRLLDVSDDKAYLVTDEYALAKARQEDILRGQSRRNWTIVRPSITYAENRIQFGCLEAISFLPRVLECLPVAIPEQMLERRTTMTWAGDVAEMIASVLLSPTALAEDFNVMTSENRSWREIGEIYQHIIGLRILPVSLQDYLSLGLNRYQVIYDRMFDRICDNTKIREIVSLDPATLTTPEDGLRRSLQGTTIEKASLSRLQGRMDKLAGLNRLSQARSMKEAAGYAFGQSGILNWLAVQTMSRRFAPIFKT